MKTLFFVNPITEWLHWWWNTFRVYLRFGSRSIRIEYMAIVKHAELEGVNTISKHARLQHSTLGKYSYIAKHSHIAHTTIGRFCSIGPHVLCGLGAHPTGQQVSSHPLFYSPLKQVPAQWVSKSEFDEYPHTTIGHDVWIGAGTIIKDGITIGNGAIIGAGAVVTQNVPPYAIVGGVPAKIIRYRFKADQIAQLEADSWWNKDEAWIKQHRQAFFNVDAYIAQIQNLQ